MKESKGNFFLGYGNITVQKCVINGNKMQNKWQRKRYYISAAFKGNNVAFAIQFLVLSVFNEIDVFYAFFSFKQQIKNVTENVP